MKVDERFVTLAPFEFRYLLQREVTLHRPDPPTLGEDDGDRLLVDHRRPVDFPRNSRFLDPGASLVAELRLHKFEILLEPPSLPGRIANQLDQLFAFLRQLLPLA